MGQNGGQFFGLHMIAVDSQGVIYTGEVFNGERVQEVRSGQIGTSEFLRMDDGVGDANGLYARW